MKTQQPCSQFCRRSGLALALLILGLMPISVRSQISPAQANEFRNGIGDKIEAGTILGADVGLAGAKYHSTSGDGKDINVDVSKFGGAGDVGSPRQIGDLPIAWQPRLQGSMGTLKAEKKYEAGLLAGDKSETTTFSIQFGGGARFWFNDNFSVAPTVMGMYGHAENDYKARSAFAIANKAAAKKQGLIDWDADTWTIRPAIDLQYVITWERVIISFNSDPTLFHTESFQSSSSNVSVDGDSETWANKIDVDIPLGKSLFGHELRTGGFFSRTELFDGIEKGLNTDHIYELHGRVVLDFLGELWKVQWIGLGASYLWGSNFYGYAFGADVAFRF